MAMTLVSTTVLSTATQQVSFSNIPQNGKDLLLVISARSDRGFNHDAISIDLNGSGGNYRKLTGNGSSVTSPEGSQLTRVFFPASPITADTFGNASIYISNYTSSNAKSVSVDSVAENNATISDQGIEAGLSTSTSPVTSITIPALNNFVANSSFSLYIIS